MPSKASFGCRISHDKNAHSAETTIELEWNKLETVKKKQSKAKEWKIKEDPFPEVGGKGAEKEKKSGKFSNTTLSSFSNLIICCFIIFFHYPTNSKRVELFIPDIFIKMKTRFAFFLFPFKLLSDAAFLRFYLISPPGLLLFNLAILRKEAFNNYDEFFDLVYIFFCKELKALIRSVFLSAIQY
ncbi:hypothetical protein ES288_D09G171000v1 [Gossypium darwinii]|uniref:Uncharacterized protein n=1 Tax=Gossypium darwinii TaxID=34276 RepID=A0A5D2BBA5_GOSDA|nr:hypothetical protein ES288_D09G171000v1 [Gossypium darwinii]